jgi:hypothetical protein
MSGESTCPAASDALLDLIRNTTGVLTTDGMGLTDSEAPEVVQVGYVDTDEDSFAEGNATWEGAGGNRDRDQYDIHCCIIVVNGENDAGNPRSARDRVFAILAQIRALLQTPGLQIAPGVINASVTSWSYRPDLIEGGARALLRFDINIDSYTLP